MEQNHKPAIVGSIVALVILVVGGVWILSRMSMKTKPDQAYTNVPKEQDTNKTSGQNTGGITLSKADAQGLVDGKTLECVPRGHDYYRTNSTLAVDPKDENIVYVGIEYKGVYKTTDGGATWKQSDSGVRGYPMEGDPTKKCIQELGRTAIDPADNKHLLISRVESPGTLKTLFSENAGVYESKDGGATWAQLIKPGMNASGSQAIAFDPKNSQVIYHGVNNMTSSFGLPNGEKQTEYFNKEGILYKTTDGGKAWAELPTGAEHGFRAMNVAVDPSNSSKIWFFTFGSAGDGGTLPDSQQKGVMLTTDGGKTWKSFADKFPAGYKTLAGGWASSINSNNVFVATQTQSTGPKSFFTIDSGATWKETSPYILVAGYDSTDTSGNHLLGYAPYASAPGIYDSKDGGATWKLLSKLPSDMTDTIRVSNFAWSSNKDIVYMSGSGALVWKSTDGGKTWKTVMNLDTVGGPNKNKDGQTNSREQDH